MTLGKSLCPSELVSSLEGSDAGQRTCLTELREGRMRKRRDGSWHSCRALSD